MQNISKRDQTIKYTIFVLNKSLEILTGTCFHQIWIEEKRIILKSLWCNTEFCLVCSQSTFYVIFKQKIEQKKTVRDSSGREETTVTRTLGDKSHTLTTRVDPSGIPETTETFTNIDEGMSKFLQFLFLNIMIIQIYYLMKNI